VRKQIGSLLLAALILSGSFSAEAARYSCQSLFTTSLSDVMTQFDKDNNGFLFKQDLQVFQESLSWNRKRKIRKILNEVSLDNMISEKQVDRFAVELGTILFDKRETVDNWIFKSPKERMQDSAVGIIREKILREGLNHAWGGYSPIKTGKLDKFVKGFRWVNDKANSLQASWLGTLLQFPFALPKIQNQEISNELMRKIILDGYDKHANEVAIALKSQSKIEAYETFRRIYAPAVMGTVVVVIFYISWTMIQERNKQTVATYIADQQKTRSFLEKIPEVKRAILEESIQKAREEFIQKWQDMPTAEEELELQEQQAFRIFGVRTLDSDSVQ
jgi:hypothetical protein